MNITIHKLKIATGFALLGVVVAGVISGIVGAQEYSEILRGATAVFSVGVAKYFHAF